MQSLRMQINSRHWYYAKDADGNWIKVHEPYLCKCGSDSQYGYLDNWYCSDCWIKDHEQIHKTSTMP